MDRIKNLKEGIFMPQETIHAKGLEIGIYTNDFNNEFISLTDIARYQNINDTRFVIRNWMRNRDTIEFLGVWEQLHNSNFNSAGFGTIYQEAGKNAFIISPEKWIIVGLRQMKTLASL